MTSHRTTRTLSFTVAPRRPWPAFALVLLGLGLGAPTAAQEAFRPDLYFAGRTRSSGVIEAGAFGNERRFEGETSGRRGADGTVTFDQVIRFADGKRQARRWVLRRTGPDTYVATANGVVGEARGTVQGRTLRLAYTLVPEPGSGAVEMDQVMELQADGVTLSNHTLIGTSGFPLRTVNETFTRTGRTPAR